MSDLNTIDSELLVAAKEGDLQRAQTLLKQLRAELSPSELTASHLRQPLIESLSANKPPMVSYLLDQGAELNSYIVTIALPPETSIDMYQVFLDHGWDINSITSNNAPLLKDVVEFEPVVRFFLTHGADPKACGPRRFNILDVAAAMSTPVVFELLLQYGADLGDSDALHAAAGVEVGTTGRLQMIAFLLDTMKMDVNAIAKYGPPATRGLGRGTPLHSAIFAQATDRIEFLLARGADPDARNTLNQTALEFAVEWELSESVDILSKRNRRN